MIRRNHNTNWSSCINYTKRMNNYYNAFLEHEIVGAKLAKEFELLLYNKSTSIKNTYLNH